MDFVELMLAVAAGTLLKEVIESYFIVGKKKLKDELIMRKKRKAQREAK